MATGNVPVAKTAGGTDVPARLAALDRSQRSAVLATVDGNRPYTSLVSFALTPDGRGIVFATPRATAKYNNLRANPEVSLLIDNRSNTSADIMGAEAITVMGAASSMRRGQKRDELSTVLKRKHPELAGFVDSDTTALILVAIKKAVHVGSFQKVSIWEPEKERGVTRPAGRPPRRRT